MNIEQFFKINNIKVTKGRISIFKILQESDFTVTVEYIYEQCKNKNINIDLSTIYRNLELFNNKGIVDKLNLGDGKYNYIINKNKHKHILECSICHKEVEIDCPLQQVEQIIKNKTGFTVKEEELGIKLKGICEDCMTKKHS
ncbi:Fe2+ or Zn2+ uptake regulation protein [Clostridium tetanomorphum]|uniref:Transcriptional repressor n=1 Tax=Clostridium tetanomorphum TaxID=1553 RepID=A0A923E8D1_CLOTT|nr:transcriptional repressor [Clostridium tetanomorphum]KAJ50880.1 ferric uptake regulation protein (Fe2+/Zn2+) [Clostridium tetanomorphum DSM 665]KAJ52130.1 ferric uptake regulation protein (Fe2+/Zn2+) [Clostridium tetanomorphum DSM 665]MBC2397132.1 transcriptional repressor [Clostridium tetanomorphum]MBP1863054.1 Fe2+ or Zn2+ uptake regulation protein [Clostridium tetanomorphum]NRS82883.1 Fe2+ or Zn2+ uptake regulation protein [Clostridium tetanomorphum]